MRAGSVLLLVTVGLACGYRPVARELPRGVRSVHVAAPAVSNVDEPGVAPLLQQALAHELARRGVRVTSRTGRGAAELHTRVLALEGGRSALGRRAIVGVELVLRIELRLVAGDGRTLWSSGIVEIREQQATRSTAPVGEQQRRAALARLARRVAAVAIDRLVDSEPASDRGDE